MRIGKVLTDYAKRRFLSFYVRQLSSENFQNTTLQNQKAH